MRQTQGTDATHNIDSDLTYFLLLQPTLMQAVALFSEYSMPSGSGRKKSSFWAEVEDEEGISNGVTCT